MTETAPPRRAAVVELLVRHARPLHASEVATALAIAPRDELALNRVIDDLVFDGTLVALPGRRFRLAKDQRAVVGRETIGKLSAHPRGFGFVACEGEDDDLFIPPDAMAGAMHGDQVVAKLVGMRARGPEGAVVRVVTRRNPRIAGVLRKRGKSAWVEPDDPRIRGPIVVTSREDALEGKDGDAVVARIDRFPEHAEENPEGGLDAVLGEPGDPEVEVQKILLAEGVVEAHDARAIAEAEAFGSEVEAAALAGREDLTHLPLPTIDPVDARDHDDALWAERTDQGGYRVWVAIADVSHYVRPNTALDSAAVARACSLYLPTRSIPMLPRALSSNLCSLLPNQLRLCVAMVAELDATGEVTTWKLVEGFMRSAAKLNYEGVARTLGMSTSAPRQPEADALRDGLEVLRDVSTLLRARRMRRGALNLELPEAKIVLEGENPIDVVKRTQDPGMAKAYHMVEELMLLANETVAKLLIERDVPGIFRNHAPPDLAKLMRFAELCDQAGLPFDAEEGLDPKQLSRFLQRTHGHPRQQVLHSVLMRSMKQALYEVDNRGHFGLASEGYVHFTSPIRRYPDVVVHRIVKAVLRGEQIDRSENALGKMRDAAATASERERQAMTVERQVIDLHRAIVMRSRVGDLLPGLVSGIAVMGVFVTIDEPYVDVLVRGEALGAGEYQPDEHALAMIAPRSGDRIELGDAMLVQIEEASIMRRTVYARRIRDESEDAPVQDGRRVRRSLRSGTTTPDRGAPQSASAGGRNEADARKGKGKAKDHGKGKAKGKTKDHDAKGSRPALGDPKSKSKPKKSKSKKSKSGGRRKD